MAANMPGTPPHPWNMVFEKSNSISAPGGPPMRPFVELQRLDIDPPSHCPHLHRLNHLLQHAPTVTNTETCRDISEKVGQFYIV